jgi:hypothetical protein
MCTASCNDRNERDNPQPIALKNGARQSTEKKVALTTPTAFR